jgi:FKBP-type peptidyl-prolyl cis-trans isomerase FklB
MKKIIAFIFVMAPGLILFSQAKKKTQTSLSTASVLKTTGDSVSYAIGLSVAGFFKEQGIQSVNTSLVSKAINDILRNGKPQLSEQQANGVIMGCVQRVKEQKSAVNKKAGEEFLTANKIKPGVVTLPSGLQYIVLKEGTGPKPLATDKVKCHYQGTLLDGTIFDSSIQRGQPIDFTVTGVIPGWTEALQLMPVGSKWRLFIPASLAYGDQQAGKISPGSTLIFDLELLEIVK